MRAAGFEPGDWVPCTGPTLWADGPYFNFTAYCPGVTA